MHVELNTYTDFTDFTSKITAVSSAGNQVVEVMISKEIWEKWIADPAVMMLLDPVAKVEDLDRGWLATLFGFEITGQFYIPGHDQWHCIPLMDPYYMIVSQPVAQAPDLLGLAQQIATP
jgi:hypothetical protein